MALKEHVAKVCVENLHHGGHGGKEPTKYAIATVGHAPGAAFGDGGVAAGAFGAAGFRAGVLDGGFGGGGVRYSIITLLMIRLGAQWTYRSRSPRLDFSSRMLRLLWPWGRRQTVNVTNRSPFRPLRRQRPQVHHPLRTTPSFHHECG